MCFVWISELTAIISLYNINWLIFITEPECVYCAVRNRYLNTIQISCRLQSCNSPCRQLNSNLNAISCPLYGLLSVPALDSRFIRVQSTRRNVSQFIYFCKTLYMFETVFLSIIRSSMGMYTSYYTGRTICIFRRTFFYHILLSVRFNISILTN